MSRLAVLLLLIALPTGLFAACSENTVDLRGDWGRATFTVEIADSVRERSRGLMHREAMDRGAGMLFVYDRPQKVAFWMRNTLIPLDMIFVDETGTVRHVHENAIPLDETSIPGGNNILLVLEINGGLSGQFGISPGTQLRHPSLKNSKAIWPCS